MAERSLTLRYRAEIDQLKSDNQAAAESIRGVGAAGADAAGETRSAMDQLGEIGSGAGRAIGAAVTVAATSLAGLTAATFATGLAYNSLEQTSRAALTTLLGSAQAANEQMDRLREFGATSPFPRQVWIQAQQQLLAFGMAAERIIPTLAAIQDGVAAAGGSAVDIQEIVRVLAQVQSTGRVTAETLNQLGVRGIDAATLIGNAMGRTAEQIRDDISSGALDAASFLEVLTAQMTDRFGGAAENVRATWVGATDRIKGALRDIGSAIAEPFVDPRGGGAAVQWGNDVADSLRAFEAALRPAVAILDERAEPAFARLSERMQGLADALGDVDLVAVMDQVARGAPVFAGLGASLAVLGSRGLPVLGAMAGILGPQGPLIAGLAAAAVASPELRGALAGLLEAVMPLAPSLIDAGMALATSLATGLSAVAEVLHLVVPLVVAIVDLFGLLPGPIQSATLALGAFALALRMAGPVGVALTAIAALGAGIEALSGGTKIASTDIDQFGEDILRMAQRGRATGELLRLFGEGSEGFVTALGRAAEEAERIENSFRAPSILLGGELGKQRASLEAFEEMDKALAGLVRTGEDGEEILLGLARAFGLTDEEMATLRSLLPETTAEMERNGQATRDAAEDQMALEGGIHAVNSSLKEQHDLMRAAADPMFALHKALRDVDDAQQAYNDAVEEYGPKSQQAEDAAVDLLDAVLDLTGAADNAEGAFKDGLPPAFRAAAAAAGVSEEAIDAVERAFKNAESAGNSFAKEYWATVGVNYVVAGQHRLTPAGSPSLGELFRQHGGPIVGPSGVDAVPVRATAGEHVWTVDEVNAAGGHQAVEAMRAAVLAGQTSHAVSAAPSVGGGGSITLTIRGDGTAASQFIVDSLRRSSIEAGGLGSLVMLNG